MRLKVREVSLQLLLYILPHFSPRPTDVLESLLRAFSGNQALSLCAPCAHLQVSLEMSALFHKCDGFQWPEPWSWLTYQLNFKLMSNCFCTSQTSYGPEGKTSKWLGKSRSKPSSLKRPTEKAWTQKLLKIFMQSLLRNVRKYYFRILWHIMRTGNLRYESTIQHEESSFMCQVTF